MGGGGSFGRIAAGTWDGLLRELVPGCRGDFRAVTPRCQQASCCVCGVRAGGGAVERAVFLTAVGTCAGLPRGLPSGSGAVLTGRVLRLRGPGG